MNKNDLKKLHADPRYKAAAAAHAALVDVLRRLDAEAAAAMAQYVENGGVLRPNLPSLEKSAVSGDGIMLDALRPRGDMCRVGGLHESYELEIVSVSAARVVFDWSEFDLHSGEGRGRYSRNSIHPEDLARIKAGELKGWRQKEWGK